MTGLTGPQPVIDAGAQMTDLGQPYTPPTMDTRMLRLRRQLESSFHPMELDIQDDGAQHAGHAHEGSGHFSVRIVAPVFASRSRLQRHRMIYAALGNMLQTDIHALSIKALAPGEFR